MIPQLRILQELQEEFDADPEIDLQIVMFNWNPMYYGLETEIANETEPCFPAAEATDIPYGMWDQADAVDYQGVPSHPLDIDVWVLYPESMDTALLDPEGNLLGKYQIYGYSWSTEGLKDFILSTIEQ